MNSYKVLNKQNFENGNFSIVPIRFEDRMDIMKWRNEQIYHLRQEKPISEKHQNNYFTNVIGKLFHQNQPNQILFSFLEKSKCIGYGGLVHINWVEKNAEVSFIMQTNYEKDRFDEIWSIFLVLLQEVAFIDLKIHKMFTYAFDVRPHLYVVLEKAGFCKEAILKKNLLFNGEYLDVIIHSKTNKL
jgi:RimJ/RimL family protein N-acetyltransferase